VSLTITLARTPVALLPGRTLFDRAACGGPEKTGQIVDVPSTIWS
jgi:hypothetical protein